jgi:hypothetical protein
MTPQKKNDHACGQTILFGIIWALIIFSFAFTCIAIKYAYSIDQKTIDNYTSIKIMENNSKYMVKGIKALLKHNQIEGINYVEE